MPRNKGKSHTSSDAAFDSVDNKSLLRAARTERPQVKGVHPTPATLDKSVTSTIRSAPVVSGEVVGDPQAHLHQYSDRLQQTFGSDTVAHTQGIYSEKKKHRQEMATLLKNPGPKPQEKLKSKKNKNKSKVISKDQVVSSQKDDVGLATEEKDKVVIPEQQQEQQQMSMGVNDQTQIPQSHELPKLSERLDIGDKPGISEEQAVDQQVKVQEQDKGYVGFVPAFEHGGEHKDQGLQQQQHLDQGKLDQGKLDQGKLDQGKLDQGKLDQGKLDQGKLDQGKLDQGKLDQGKLDQGKLDQGKLDQDQSFVYHKIGGQKDDISLGADQSQSIESKDLLTSSGGSGIDDKNLQVDDKQQQKQSIMSEDKQDLSQLSDVDKSAPHTSEEVQPLLSHSKKTDYSDLNKDKEKDVSSKSEKSDLDLKDDVVSQNKQQGIKDDDKPVMDKRKQEEQILPSIQSSETQDISRPSGSHIPDKHTEDLSQKQQQHHSGLHRFGVRSGKIGEDISGILPHLKDVATKPPSSESQEPSLKQMDQMQLYTQGVGLPQQQLEQQQQQPGSNQEDISKAPMKNNPLQRENIQNKDIEHENRESNRPELPHQTQHQKGEHVHEDQPGQVQSSKLPDVTDLQRTQDGQEQIKLHDQHHEAIYGKMMNPTQADDEAQLGSQHPTQPQQSQLRNEKRQA